MMKWMQRGMQAAAVVCLVAAQGPALAQIPVTDVASLTQQIQQVMAWGQQYDQMVESLEKYKTQIENQVRQIQSVTGGRGMGNLLQGMTRQAIPSDFVSMADKLRQQGAGGASGAAKAVYEAIKTYDCSKRFPGSVASQRSCEATALATPQNIALLNDSVEASRKRQAELKSFASSIDAASDIKAAADLANRLTLELAYLQNEKTLMDMAARQLEQQKQLTAERNAEEGTKRMTNGAGGGVNPFAGGL